MGLGSSGAGIQTNPNVSASAVYGVGLVTALIHRRERESGVVQ